MTSTHSLGGFTLLVTNDKEIISEIGETLQFGWLSSGFRYCPPGDSVPTIINLIHPVLLLLDLDEAKNEIQYLQEIKNAYMIPTMTISSKSDKDISDAALKNGSLYHFYKPIDRKEIITRYETFFNFTGKGYLF